MCFSGEPYFNSIDIYMHIPTPHIFIVVNKWECISGNAYSNPQEIGKYWVTANFSHLISLLRNIAPLFSGRTWPVLGEIEMTQEQQNQRRHVNQITPKMVPSWNGYFEPPFCNISCSWYPQATIQLLQLFMAFF